MSGKSTGLMGWARPEAGFASGRGGARQLPLQSKTNAGPSRRLFFHRTGATGEYFPAMDAGPASRPPADLTSLATVQQLTTHDYTSIHDRERSWARDSTGEFARLERDAPRQPPISARIVDQFASAREPALPAVRERQHQERARALSCEPPRTGVDNDLTSPELLEFLELQRRVGDIAREPGLVAWPHAPGPSKAVARAAARAPTEHGRIITLRPKPRSQLPSLEETNARKEARARFHAEEGGLPEFDYSPPAPLRPVRRLVGAPCFCSRLTPCTRACSASLPSVDCKPSWWKGCRSRSRRWERWSSRRSPSPPAWPSPPARSSTSMSSGRRCSSAESMSSTRSIAAKVRPLSSFVLLRSGS